VLFCCQPSDLESDISEKEKGSQQDCEAHVFSQVNWDSLSVLLIQIRISQHHLIATWSAFKLHGSEAGSEL
jgi:hypothetical protein